MATPTVPLRPATERDLMQAISGMPVFLGVITSTAAVAANNATTAKPFLFERKSPQSLTGTLAGRILLLQPTAPGLILPSDDSSGFSIVQQTAPSNLVPPLALPGVLIGTNERVEITMGQSTGWLQFLAVTGDASLLVWEMI